MSDRYLFCRNVSIIHHYSLDHLSNYISVNALVIYIYIYIYKNKPNKTISSEIKEKTYPTVTSNMFEPTDDDTAISPFPCFATKTLVIKSGTDVPAAKKVNPIT